MVSYKTANKPGVKPLAFLRLKSDCLMKKGTLTRMPRKKRNKPMPRKHRK